MESGCESIRERHLAGGISFCIRAALVDTIIS